MIVTREMWAHDFLKKAGWPRVHRNITTLICWTSAEGTTAKWNPLATTQKMPGSTDFNSVGVQNYVDKASGLEATLRTLYTPGHLYGGIRWRLRVGAWPSGTLKAIERSDWGTGGLALEILDDVRAHWSTYASVAIGQ